MATGFNPINIGIDNKDRKAIADGLCKLLADTYVLQVKAHGFHVNVESILFGQLHALFKQSYEDLNDATDVIGERIRQLGYRAPGSLKEFMILTEIRDSAGVVPSTRMVAELAQDYSTITKFCHELVGLANKCSDLTTIDLLTQRMKAQEFTGWQLRASMA